MIKKLSFVLLFIATAALSIGQTKKEQAVAAAVASLRQAMIDGDSVLLDKLTGDKLSYGHSGGHVQDKAEFIHSFTTGASDFVTIDLTEQTISISGNTAIVRHKLTANTNDKGKQPTTVKLAVLTVWQKQHNQWKLIARQAVHV
jgi:ketosteroid isomerase-like protein